MRNLSKASLDVPKKIIDPKSETIDELVKAAGGSYSKGWMTDYATKMVKAGKWERVWKKGTVRPVPSYRRKA